MHRVEFLENYLLRNCTSKQRASCGEDDEITMDARSRCRIARGQWPLRKHGRAVRSQVSFYLPRYEQTVKTCQSDSGKVNPSDLAFATKFLATYLFIKVKGSLSMTYQYLTVEIIKAAKANGGFLTDTSIQILDGYINFVSPLLKPQCNFVLVTKSGNQHSKLGNEISKLVLTQLANSFTPRVIAKSWKH